MANARFSKGTKRKKYPAAKFPERVTFRLSRQDMERLQELAESEGLGCSVLVRNLVTRFLEDRRSRLLAMSRFGLEP